MQLTFHQLIIPPGQSLLLRQIDWQWFENLLELSGEHRTLRFSYSQGMLEIMVPSVEHEYDKRIIGNLVEIILEELNMEFIPLGSTTFKHEKMEQAIEADDCFYIQHEALIRGKKRIDLTVDPPPDLAIEIDITSRTRLDNYEKLGVPELWRYDGENLEINVLQNGRYVTSATSIYFPHWPLREVIPHYIQQSQIVGRNKTMKAFRAWVRNSLNQTGK